MILLLLRERPFCSVNDFIFSASGESLLQVKNMLITFCPGRGSNKDLLRANPTLYRVAVKAGLYRKAIQVCIKHIPSPF